MFHLISRYNTIAKTIVLPSLGSNTFFWNCKGSTELQPGFSHSVSPGRMNFHHALKKPDNAILRVIEVTLCLCSWLMSHAYSIQMKIAVKNVFSNGYVIAGRSQATDIHGIVSDGSACWPFLLSVGY